MACSGSPSQERYFSIHELREALAIEAKAANDGMAYAIADEYVVEICKDLSELRRRPSL